jgi:hypothetical protein
MLVIVPLFEKRKEKRKKKKLFPKGSLVPKGEEKRHQGGPQDGE